MPHLGDNDPIWITSGHRPYIYVLSHFSHVHLFAILWTLACQASLSMGFSRQEYWSGLPFPSPGNLPNPGIEPGSPALQADSLPTELQKGIVELQNQLFCTSRRKKKVFSKEKSGNFCSLPGNNTSSHLPLAKLTLCAKRRDTSHCEERTWNIPHWKNCL